MMVMRINKIVIIFLMFVFVGMTFAKEFRVGVVDSQRILNESSYVKDMEIRIMREFQPKNEELENKYKQLQNKITYITRDKEILSEKEKSNKEREITKMEANLRELAQELDFEYRDTQREEHFNLNKVVEKITVKVAVQEKIDIVFQNSSLLYHNDSLDITDIILIKMENEYKSK